MLETIKHAIAEKAVLRISYPPGLRIIEPHALGYSSKGNLLLRCFQSSGASVSNKPVAWKIMSVDRISQAERTGETFPSARPGYNPAGDPAMKGGILAKL